MKQSFWINTEFLPYLLTRLDVRVIEKITGMVLIEIEVNGLTAGALLWSGYDRGSEEMKAIYSPKLKTA
jgi:hypothetical protein